MHDIGVINHHLDLDLPDQLVNIGLIEERPVDHLEAEDEPTCYMSA
jgi:hypothetical protein